MIPLDVNTRLSCKPQRDSLRRAKGAPSAVVTDRVVGLHLRLQVGRVDPLQVSTAPNGRDHSREA